MADKNKEVKFATKGRGYLINLGERTGDDYPIVYVDLRHDWDAAKTEEFVIAIVPFFHEDGHAWLVRPRLDGSLHGIPLERIRD